MGVHRLDVRGQPLLGHDHHLPGVGVVVAQHLPGQELEGQLADVLVSGQQSQGVVQDVVRRDLAATSASVMTGASAADEIGVKPDFRAELSRQSGDRRLEASAALETDIDDDSGRGRIVEQASSGNEIGREERDEREVSRTASLNAEYKLPAAGGELVAMAPKDRRHEVLRTELALYWGDRRGRDLKIVSESPLRLGKHDAPEPDLIVFPASLFAPDVRADTVLLVVEIANSSFPKDMHIKAPRYAAAGVREYWVIDAREEDDLRFDIYKRGKKEFVAARRQEGWVRSAVLGKSFRLSQSEAPDGEPDFSLEVR